MQFPYMNKFSVEKFSVGLVVITPGAAEVLGNIGRAQELLARHAAGDWGDIGLQDWQANDRALELGERLVSAYNQERRVWIITERDRKVTTILLPEEY